MALYKKHITIDWKTVGRRIRELRGFDITQAKFAASIGVSQSFLSQAERGQTEIGAEILLRISREFGRSMEWILTGNDGSNRKDSDSKGKASA